MLEPREDADLAQEALGARERGELAAEHLDGDRPGVADVLRVHDDGGPAPRGDAQELVPVGEMWGQSLKPAVTTEAMERVKLLTQENAQLRAEVSAMQERLQVVERIVTDGGYRLGHEIERLRDEPRLTDKAKN